jgi:hypothetical protein
MSSEAETSLTFCSEMNVAVRMSRVSWFAVEAKSQGFFGPSRTGIWFGMAEPAAVVMAIESARPGANSYFRWPKNFICMA